MIFWVFLYLRMPVGGVSHPQSAAEAQDVYCISSDHFKEYPAVPWVTKKVVVLIQPP